MRWFFPRFRPAPEHRPRATAPRSPHLRLRWLGTAGHVLETPETTLLFDPFLSRPSLWETGTAPLRSTPDRWWKWLPPRVDAILLGHSHYDHLLDAPVIALRTGAKLVGSRTTVAFARAAGVPEAQCVTVPPEGLSLPVGALTVKFIPSLHGRILAGRVPFPGEVLEPPRSPRFFHYRMGGAFGIHVPPPGPAVYHNGSADLIDAELTGLTADVLLAGLAGRQATKGYLARLVSLLRPSLVLPTHHDGFFAPLEDGVRLLPGINLPGFLRDVRDAAPSARVLLPTYTDLTHVPLEGRASEATMSPW